MLKIINGLKKFFLKNKGYPFKIITAIGLILGILFGINEFLNNENRESLDAIITTLNDINDINYKNDVQFTSGIYVNSGDVIINTPVKNDVTPLIHSSKIKNWSTNSNQPNYFLDSESIDLNYKYILSNSYYEVINISNINEKNDIQLKNFKFITEKIEKVNKPLLFYKITVDEFNKAIYHITNKGWDDANDLTFYLYDEIGKLFDIIPEEKTKSYVKKIKPGQTISLTLIDNDYFNSEYINIVEDSFTIKPKLEVINADSLLYEMSQAPMIVVSKEANKILLVSDGQGGMIPYNYGICIDAFKESFTLEEQIDINIIAGEIKTIPIYFYPNRSCKITYHIEFEVLNGREIENIKTESKTIEFSVSSVITEEELKMNNGIYMEKENINEVEEFFISFPFINKFSK